MRRAVLAAFLPALMLVACASGSKKSGASASSSGKGFRVLEAVVVGRSYEPPLSGGTALSGSGTWYLDFEAKDGEATVHYRFPVSRSDYNRYGDGRRVQLLMADDRLREIRSAP